MSSGREIPALGAYLPPAASLSRSGSSTSNTSPIEPSNAGSLRSPFLGALNSGKMPGSVRSGAGSPSHDLGSGSSRLFSSKRAREIQAQEGVLPNVWGPPTSGGSTPLRENIPESPTTDGFPDFSHQPMTENPPQSRRPRAGTVPSRFSPGGLPPGLGIPPLAKSSRPTPSGSPFNGPSPSLSEIGDNTMHSNADLLSRLRSGSMPQRQYPSSSGPFGQSVFATNWSTGRERTSTLASIASLGSNGPASPARSSMSRENGETDMQMRTLDYLGLADTPTTPRATAPASYLAGMNLADLTRVAAHRFRSYSVNAKEKYAEEEDDDYVSGQMTPYETQQAQLHLQLAATNAAIQQHNLAVQAYANQASANRPRARTAGVLETPGTKLLRNYYPTPSRLDNALSAGDIQLSESPEYETLPEAVAAMNLGRSSSRNDNMLSPDDNLEGPTRALWLGSIPSSTTVSTLTEMFKSHGLIISARVLTHKNCGFVNFERLESAISARAMMNGKEIFPGAGPVRINFAKPPSPGGTPGPDNGAFPSPSPDPFAKGQDHGTAANGHSPGVISRPSTAGLKMATLADMKSDILDIVSEFGATKEDKAKITHSLQQAITYDRFQSEIPPIQEPGHNRIHDAPKLRDIRKRIDNQSWSPAEIEGIASDMLSEVAELSSDYLGNTVVQKLFEHCSDEMRDNMLVEITPHMAEIGIHKNGTWAAQKIIDVCKTPKQMGMIVSNLQPYTVPLFLDQYGNYVLQCCLKFGSPFNDFIFEAMLSQMWEIAQGRYGARAMRACLESHHSTKDQQRMLAAAIALHSVQLATNANGALLLTWFLDTCTFPQRRTVLAPQLVPHLIHLCTHKVAYLTVLKVINQKLEPAARDVILQALFFSPNHATLEAILLDHNCGATLIFKVLTTPFFDESIRSSVVENVRHVLQTIKAQPSQGYKRLMDEVGLSTRQGSTGPSREAPGSAERPRPGSNHGQVSGHMPPQFSNQFYPQVQQPTFDIGLGMQRTDSVDSNIGAFPPNNAYGLPNPMFTPSAIQPMNIQQLQYQQSLLSRAAAPMNNFYASMQSGFGGYNNQSPAVDPFRNGGMNPSPVPAPHQMAPAPLMGQGFGAPPGFGGMGMGIGGMNGFGYGMNGMNGMPGMNGMNNMNAMGAGGQIPLMGNGYAPQEQQVNGRRGRR